MFSFHNSSKLIFLLSCAFVIVLAISVSSFSSSSSLFVEAKPSPLGKKTNRDSTPSPPSQKQKQNADTVLGSNEEELSQQKRRNEKNKNRSSTDNENEVVVDESRKTKSTAAAVEQQQDESTKNKKGSSQEEQEKTLEKQQEKKNLPLDHPDMAQFHPHVASHNDASFQADHTPKGEKLSSEDKNSAEQEIETSRREKRELEKQRHPAASQQFVELHGQRVSIASLQTMCKHLAVDHLPFLKIRSSRELELATLFAANRLMSVFEGHVAEKRLVNGVEGISCPHGVAIAQTAEATKLYDLISEAQREIEGIRLHLLDLADAWTITQSKDSDLVEEVVASLGYYSTLSRVGNTVLQKISYLTSGGAITTSKDGDAKCVKMVQELAHAVKEIPDGVPNWTHMKVGAEMLSIQCDMEPSLQNGDL